MSSFEMIVKDVFYLTDGRMIFSGHFSKDSDVHLPLNVVVYVNEEMVAEVELTNLPFSSGESVRRKLDVI